MMRFKDCDSWCAYDFEKPDTIAGNTWGNWMDVPLEVRINGERINGLFHLVINGVYWGYNPLTNHLLTSWDIQVEGVFKTS